MDRWSVRPSVHPTRSVIRCVYGLVPLARNPENVENIETYEKARQFVNLSLSTISVFNYTADGRYRRLERAIYESEIGLARDKDYSHLLKKRKLEEKLAQQEVKVQVQPAARKEEL